VTAGGTGMDLDEITASENGWTVGHARRVVADALSRAAAPPRNPAAYVRTVIANGPARHAPTFVPDPSPPPGCDDPDCDLGWLPGQHGRVTKCPTCYPRTAVTER